MFRDRFWQDYHYTQLESMRDFHDMFLLATSILENMPDPVAQVCGPISTGDRSLEENIKIFHNSIKALTATGHVVFNQMPFQDAMMRVIAENKINGYPFALLDEFFLPLFEFGKIRILHFLPGWEKSTGSRWEHDQGKRLGLEIKYLPDNWIETIS